MVSRRRTCRGRAFRICRTSCYSRSSGRIRCRLNRRRRTNRRSLCGHRSVRGASRPRPPTIRSPTTIPASAPRLRLPNASASIASRRTKAASSCWSMRSGTTLAVTSGTLSSIRKRLLAKTGVRFTAMCGRKRFSRARSGSRRCLTVSSARQRNCRVPRRIAPTAGCWTSPSPRENNCS